MHAGPGRNARGPCSGIILVALSCCFGLAQASAREIIVFAASSLTDALKEIRTAYQKKSGEQVVLNFGASSMLARQIEELAPADIFFSADEAKMNELENKALILKETRRSRLSNVLAIVVSIESADLVHSTTDLAKPQVKRIALGDPRGVPIGIYARQYLEKMDLWEQLAPKIIVTENVRAALAAVEAGNVDASIVYQTDVANAKKVKIAFKVPVDEAPKISYPAAVLKGSHEPRKAKRFLDYLFTEEAGKVFASRGFIVLPETK